MVSSPTNHSPRKAAGAILALIVLWEWQESQNLGGALLLSCTPPLPEDTGSEVELARLSPDTCTPAPPHTSSGRLRVEGRFETEGRPGRSDGLKYRRRTDSGSLAKRTRPNRSSSLRLRFALALDSSGRSPSNSSLNSLTYFAMAWVRARSKATSRTMATSKMIAQHPHSRTLEQNTLRPIPNVYQFPEQSFQMSTTHSPCVPIPNVCTLPEVCPFPTCTHSQQQR